MRFADPGFLVLLALPAWYAFRRWRYRRRAPAHGPLQPRDRLARQSPELVPGVRKLIVADLAQPADLLLGARAADHPRRALELGDLAGHAAHRPGRAGNEDHIAGLERGDVELEQSIDIYERGEALRTHCDQLLKRAEAKVERITLSAQGVPSGAVPFDAGV